MVAAAAGSLLVVDSEQTIRGMVTEQDVTRRMAFQGDGDVPVDWL